MLNQRIVAMKTEADKITPDMIKAKSALDNAINQAILALPSEIDPDAAEAIARHINGHVKQHIHLVDTRIPMPN